MMRMDARPRSMWLALFAIAAVAGPSGCPAAVAGGNCAQVSVGFLPLTDLGAGTYQGVTGGLYPGGSNVRPPAHDTDADSYARVALLDANGVPNPATGKIVLLTVGMSNTNFESQAFLPLANADPAKNSRVVLVNGAQGGWDAHKVADPAQNAPYWNTVDARLAAAGVTPGQVQAIWLKEAEAGPTQPFPQDSQILQGDLESIVRIIKFRYPNARQVYNSSRIYAGYAVSNLNPEPYSYQSGFAVRWMIERQINGASALNFNPGKGTVVAPWLAWGPYTWADGLTPRGDGLTWACADFRDDGTHPSDSGSAKVAQSLLGFFQTDPIASRWYLDCDTNDPDVFSNPPRVLDVAMGLNPPAGGATLDWESLGPVSGSGTRYDIVFGNARVLRPNGGFTDARCAAGATAGPPIGDPVPNPPVGEIVYYLLRGRNGCGIGTYGEPGALAGAREALDAASPCPD